MNFINKLLKNWSDQPFIESTGVRVVFSGDSTPSHLEVPVVFPVGIYRNVHIRITPRSDVELKNEVALGDALLSTLSYSHNTTIGGSFFASVQHGRTSLLSNNAYDVVFMENLRDIKFRLARFDNKREPIALRLFFPIVK